MKKNKYHNKLPLVIANKRDDFWDRAFVRTWRPYVAIAVAVLAVYFQALFFQYTSLDDEHLIIQNADIITNFKNIPLAFGKDVFWQYTGVYYRPIFVITLMIDAVWGGIKPFIFHLTNIGLHLVVSILIFRFFMALNYQRRISFVFALLFSVHPALSQAVAWVPGRNDILLMLFVLVCFGSLLKLLKIWRWRLVAVHLGALGAALFTKETALVVPIICFIYFLSVDRRNISLRRFVGLVFGWMIIMVFYGVLRQRVTGLYLPGLAFNTVGDNITGLLSYMGKAILPLNLSVYPVAADIKVYPWLTVIVGLLIIWLVWGVDNKRMFLGGALWFVLFLLPTSVRPEEYAVFLEQRLYLPLVGFLIMLMETKLLKHAKAIPVLMAMGVLFTLQTINHARCFSSNLLFWENATITSPGSFFTHRMMGKAYLSQMEAEKAEREYRKALQIKPDEIGAINELGALYINIGEMAKAESMMIRAADLYPNNAMTHNNLGYFYLINGMTGRAKKAFKQGLQITPTSVPLRRNMVSVYLDEGKYDSACIHYNEALRYGAKPDSEIETILRPYQVRPIK
jgi:hypothetical protein